VSPSAKGSDELNSLRSRLALLSEREHLLAQIDEATRSLVQPEEINLTAATLLGQHLRVNRCTYADVEPDQNTFNVTGNYIHNTHSIVGRYVGEQIPHIGLQLMRAGTPFIVEDTQTDDRILSDSPIVLETLRATDVRSMICIPILKENTFSAVMAVQCNVPRHWYPEEVSLVLSVANRCWESIERSRVLRNLQESEQRLRLAQEAGRSGTFDWYIPQDRVYWSPELEKLYEVPVGSFEGSFESWVKRLVPEDARRIANEIEQALRRKQRDYGFDFRIILPDRSQRWLHGQSHFLYADNGNPLHMIGINVDINERRLTEEALIRSEKLAIVGRLAASIAHEINNPLESVTNLIYLARHSGPAEAQSYLEQADIELRRVALIANQTLRFHRQSSNPTSVKLKSLFEGVLALHQGRLTNARVRVKKDFREDNQIVCFENEIRQVLSNLIGNAIDALPSGGTLSLRSYRRTDALSGRPGVAIVVADNGTGMPPFVVEKLFEPFFSTKGFNGTGLGLWISQEIIQRHGGRLRVRSSQRYPFRGTLFSLFLPLSADKRPA
jgi:signal transduction histidine kinase